MDKIVYMDPIGKIVFYEDWEDGSAYTVKGFVGSGAETETIASDTTYAYQGAKSLKLTTENLSTATAIITQNLGLVKGYPKLGVSFMWMTTDALTAFGALTIGIKRYDGVTVKEGRVQYDGSDEQWHYWDGSNYIDMAGSTKVTTDTQEFTVGAGISWNHCKLVLDFTADTYNRLITNDVTHALTDIALNSTADATTKPHFEIAITINAQTTTAFNMWIDNYIVTMEHR